MSKVRVLRTGLTFGGWKGTLTVDGDILRIVGDDGVRRLDIDGSQIKRYSHNGTNGLWALRMRDGRKLYLQSSGWLLSADRSPAGRATNDAIGELLQKHQAGGFRL